MRVFHWQLLLASQASYWSIFYRDARGRIARARSPYTSAMAIPNPATANTVRPPIASVSLLFCARPLSSQSYRPRSRWRSSP